MEIIDQILFQIREKEESLKNTIKKILDVNPKFYGEPIKKEVNLDLENFSIAAVDSGYSKKSLHAIDIAVIKTVGVIFQYENGKLKNYLSFPEIPKEEIIISKETSDIDSLVKINDERWKREVEVAIGILEKFNPDFFVFDGPLINPYVKEKEYLSQLKKFCKKSLIFGIVEDSRSKSFSKIISSLQFLDLQDKLNLEETIDTIFTNFLLSFKERTFVFEEPNEVLSFYLKNTQNDKPLKVEFFEKNDREKDADKISSILIKTSFNNDYAFPIILVEADLRARVNENRAEEIYEYSKYKLLDIKSFEEKRRNKRFL